VEAKQTHTYYIKNMLCNCCKELLSGILSAQGYEVQTIQPGKISFYKSGFNEKAFQALLRKHGFDLVYDVESQRVEQIKQAVVELIHYSNNVDSIVRKSDYLVERLNMTYQQISKIFSRHEKITLERYMLLHKMERVKELVMSNEFTLSEIAYMMDFSSVHHLSATFKKMVGVTVTDFKASPEKYKKAIDELL
jgi:AraC-like DNA-binding protein